MTGADRSGQLTQRVSEEHGQVEMANQGVFSEQCAVHLDWRPLASKAFLGIHLESRSNLASSVSTANTRHGAMMEVLSFQEWRPGALPSLSRESHIPCSASPNRDTW